MPATPYRRVIFGLTTAEGWNGRFGPIFFQNVFFIHMTEPIYPQKKFHFRALSVSQEMWLNRQHIHKYCDISYELIINEFTKLIKVVWWRKLSIEHLIINLMVIGHCLYRFHYNPSAQPHFLWNVIAPEKCLPGPPKKWLRSPNFFWVGWNMWPTIYLQK